MACPVTVPWYQEDSASTYHQTATSGFFLPGFKDSNIETQLSLQPGRKNPSPVALYDDEYKMQMETCRMYKPKYDNLHLDEKVKLALKKQLFSDADVDVDKVLDPNIEYLPVLDFDKYTGGRFHIRIHSETDIYNYTYTCASCKLKFEEMGNVLQHNCSSDEKKDHTVYFCQICNWQTLNKEELRTHESLHKVTQMELDYDLDTDTSPPIYMDL